MHLYVLCTISANKKKKVLLQSFISKRHKVCYKAMVKKIIL